jgi:hypothetical protein
VTETKCRSCGAAIIWMKTAAGKRMPIDAEPSEKGNIVLVEDKGNFEQFDLISYAKPGPRYTSHFATCPQAAEWRKK